MHLAVYIMYHGEHTPNYITVGVSILKTLYTQTNKIEWCTKTQQQTTIHMYTIDSITLLYIISHGVHISNHLTPHVVMCAMTPSLAMYS